VSTSTVSLKTGQSYPGKRRGPKKKEKALVAELEEIGFTRPYSAERLKWIADEGSPKEALAAVKLYAALKGDIKDDSGAASTVINTGPVMQIMGMSQERMKALRGAIAQLSPEKAEEAREARTNERLAALKRGETVLAVKHSTNEYAKALKEGPLKEGIDEPLEVRDVQSSADGAYLEAEPPKG
jgi:hypothetical protein